MGINHIIDVIQGHGCSPFFFTSAIQSGVFGEVGRQNQASLTEKNLEFKQKLQDLRAQFAREKIDAQKQFRRESYELSRQYLVHQTVLQNESRRKQIDFQNYLKKYWPLAIDALFFLKEQAHLLPESKVVPLRAMIAQTEVTAFDRRDPGRAYRQFCEDVADGLSHLGLHNVVVEERPWKSSSQSFMAETMNLNFILQGIPTLLIYPYQFGETLGIEIAVWSFNRGLQSMTYNKILKIDNLDKALITDTAVASVKALIGMTRDAYMIAEYHAPAEYCSRVEQEALAIPEVYKLLSEHYADMQKRLASDSDFLQLCTEQEVAQMKSSLSNTKLLTE